MSALPKQHLPVIEEREAEVIYLVVPPVASLAPAVIKPFTLVEQASALVYSFQIRSHRSSEKALALSFAFFLTVVVGLWAYNVKSAFGIDIFPHQHLENFVPLPGWQR